MINLFLGTICTYIFAALSYWLAIKTSFTKNIWAMDNALSVIFTILYIFFISLSGMLTIPLITVVFFTIITFPF